MSATSYRVRRHSKFSVVSNDIVEDKSLSPSARLTLIWALSRPPGWVFRQSHVAAVLGIGQEKIKSIFRELISTGYVKREGQSKEKGRWGAANYVIFDNKNGEGDDADTNQELQQSESTAGGFPRHGNRATETAPLSKTERVPPSTSRTRKTSLASNFILTEPMIAAATACGWDQARQDDEFQRFVFWNKSHGTRSADWLATWQTWIARGTEYRAATRKPRQQNGLSSTALQALNASYAANRRTT